MNKCKHDWQFARCYNQWRASSDSPFITHFLYYCPTCLETKNIIKEVSHEFFAVIANS